MKHFQMDAQVFAILLRDDDQIYDDLVRREKDRKKGVFTMMRTCDGVNVGRKRSGPEYN